MWAAPLHLLLVIAVVVVLCSSATAQNFPPQQQQPPPPQQQGPPGPWNQGQPQFQQQPSPGFFPPFQQDQQIRPKSATNTSTSDDEDDSCVLPKHGTIHETCAYVMKHSDNCEGGGYFQWTRYHYCSGATTGRVFILIGMIFYFFLLCFAISQLADDFFAPNISALVEHLGISENIAGVTFLAFGNGAPDVFGSVASVLSATNPKAELAIGELLGAGTFVVCVATGTVILLRPFKVARRPFIRDLVFYITAVVLMFVFFLYDNKIHLWEPLLFLGLYAVYACTIVFGRWASQKQRAARRRERNELRRASAMHSEAQSIPPLSIDINPSSIDSDSKQPSIHDAPSSAVRLPLPSNLSRVRPATLPLRKVTQSSSDTSPGNTIRNHLQPPAFVIEPPTPDVDAENQMGQHPLGNPSTLAVPQQLPRRFSHPVAFRFYADAGEEGLSDSDDDDNKSFVLAPGPHVLSLAELAERRQSKMLTDLPVKPLRSVREVLSELAGRLFSPIGDDIPKWSERRWWSKAYFLFTMIFTVVFRATVPLSQDVWSMPLSVLHTAVGPTVILWALQLLTTRPGHWGPGLWLYGLALSAILVTLLIIFTKSNQEPKYYSRIATLFGFLLALAWIYLFANEIVGVATTLGIVAKLSHALLGLTVLAWCNSIGDLISDSSVARQGFPRMAVSASIGGPLFNLLLGFGIPFTAAIIKGKTVSLALQPVDRVLLLFLCIALVFLLVSTLVTRFRLTRIHALVLYCIYAVFLTMALLAQFAHVTI